MRRICHLVDDTRPGGVTRFLDYVKSAPTMAALGTHEVIAVKAGLSLPPRIEADVIVSHIVLSWKNLPFFIALRARARGRTLIHMEHSYSPAFESLYVSSPARFRKMLSLSLSLFDRVITISTAQRDWLLAQTHVAPETIRLIPPYLDLSAFLALPPATGKITRIGAIGRLDPQKGFDLLIPAFLQANLPGLSLDIYGDGPEREALQTLAQGNERVVFHGHIADPVAAMRAVDAIAMPSRREPYGLVALEAMAAGRPLLVSRTDGLIDHAANGAVLVDQYNVAGWSHGLRSFCAADHSARILTARTNAKRAEARFTEGWTALLDSL